MRLYLLRHGQSPGAAEAGVARDADRPLSETGRRDVRRAAEMLSKQGGSPQLILTSPLKRAAQSAEEAASRLGPKLGTRMFWPLANQVSAETLWDQLQQEFPRVEELLLVGHQPQLGDLASHLSGAAAELRPGGLIALESRTQGRARVLWTDNPEPG